jgi:hypothetical protein
MTTTLRPTSRILLGLLACVGTVGFVLSFRLSQQQAQWLPLIVILGAAAGLSWLVFGPVLVMATRGRASILSWMDACLITMTLGIAIKTCGILLNLIASAGHVSIAIHIHLAILLLADLAMGALFCRQALARGVKPVPAIALWLTLNAIFASFILIARIGGFWR